MKKELHIGHKVKQVVYETRIPVKEFAHKINKSRTVVYHIFERKSIDTSLLQKISNVLNHNFFQYFSEKDEQFKLLNGGNKELENSKKELEQAHKEILYLKKINELLEKKKK